MNYPPPYHTETDEARVFAAIDAIRHATLIVPGEDGPLISFTPFFLDRDRRVLQSHVAARNPQSQYLDGTRVDAVFHGPHAYMSPRLNNNEDVPTWNYVNVHARGTVNVIEDPDEKWRLMAHFTRTMEGDNAKDYLASYGKRLQPMLRAITVFEVGIDFLSGRFKLGRNDEPELQQKTFANLIEETPRSLQRWLKSLAP